jgi:hypothetical protein
MSYPSNDYTITSTELRSDPLVELCSDCELPLDTHHCDDCGACDGAEHSVTCAEGSNESQWVTLEGRSLPRHKATVLIVAICTAGLVSNMSPVVMYVLNACLLAAVTVTALVAITLLAYLVGTSARYAWRERRRGFQ